MKNSSASCYLSVCLLSIFMPFLMWGEIPQATLKVMPPMNVIYHPVSTTNEEAQKHFNRGLTYIFAFNHDIAYSEFERAAELDPTLAMAYWGMALALGQNVNEDVTREDEIKCYELIQKALTLAASATKNEQAYINALSTRYTNDPHADLIPLRYHYRKAMKSVVNSYSEDLDAAALYAESILDLDPWKWWTFDGHPEEGTLEAMDILESILSRNPNHIGANHYYIHSVEESPFPERGLMAAHRLETLLPNAGHLLHMPCHIFLLTGDYESAIQTNSKAIAADREYIKTNGMKGKYPPHYLSHNLYVLARTYMLMNNYDEALKAVLELNKFIEPYVENNSHLQHFAYAPLEIFLYFHKWQEILDFQPVAKNSPLVQGYQHFSRAMAHASMGNFEAALEEKKLMNQAQHQLPEEMEVANNPASKVFELADLVLNASFAREQKRFSEAIGYLKRAISIQDRFNYDEPPAWFMPLRQTLGATFLQQGLYIEAEEEFKIALNKLRRNGLLLFGLSLALKAQQRPIDTYWVEREMTNALNHSSQPLKFQDL